MKRATDILTASWEAQKLFDQLAQTVENFVDKSTGDKFDYATKASIMAEVVDSVNNYRTIEQELFSRLSVSYTKTTYTAFDYIVKVPVPQFTNLQAIQQYYTEKLAQLAKEITADYTAWPTASYFINDGLGQGANDPNTHKPVGNTPNGKYTKTHTWVTAEEDLLAAIAVIQSSLMGDIPNVS